MQLKFSSFAIENNNFKIVFIAVVDIYGRGYARKFRVNGYSSSYLQYEASIALNRPLSPKKVTFSNFFMNKKIFLH